MSLDNLFGFTPGWKVDPTQDRRAGPVITYTLTPEELQQRYGHIKTSGERKKLFTAEETREYVARKKEERKVANTSLGIDLNKAMSICLAYGTGIAGAKEIAKEYGITDKQAISYITNRHIRRRLDDEAKVVENIESGLVEPGGIIATEEWAKELLRMPELANDVHAPAVETQHDDVVNRPAHYTTGKIEVIHYLQDKLSPDMFEGFCVGNALKYLSRYRHKGGLSDIKKAGWYVDRLIKLMEAKST